MVPVRAGYAVFYAEALQHMQKEPVAQNGSFLFDEQKTVSAP